MVELPKSNVLIEYSLFALLALLWGGSYLFLKIAIAEIPPLTLIAIRVTIASFILLLVLWCRGIRLPRERRSWKNLLFLSFFNSIGAWTLLAWSMKYLDSGLASVLNSTAPLFVFFLTLFITGRQSANGLKLAGACLGVIGVVLTVGVDVLAGLGVQVAAQLAALTGAFLYACAAVYGHKLNFPPIVAATGTMLWASLVLVPISLVVDRPWTLSLSLQAVVAALILSLFCTALALLIYFRLLRTLGALGVASQAYLRAGIGVLLGIMFLEETITPLVATGIVLCLSGVIALNYRKSA